MPDTVAPSIVEALKGDGGAPAETEPLKRDDTDELPEAGAVGRTETGMVVQKTDDEHISFDFFVNVTVTLFTLEKVQQVMCRSLDVEVKQLEDLKIVEAGTAKRALTRISGKVQTDSWEMKILSDRFQRLIPDRILSGNLMEVLHVEDRPRVSRFYSRSSLLASTTGGEKLKMYPKDEERTLSLRQEMDLEMQNSLVNTEDIRPKPGSDGPKDDAAATKDAEAQQSSGSCCIIL